MATFFVVGRGYEGLKPLMDLNDSFYYSEGGKIDSYP
jgi:hypothetical protein